MEKILQKDIAAEADVSPGFFSLILTGNRRPSWKVAKRLAQVTGTNPELWLEGEPEAIRKAIAKGVMN